jgi:ribokinase|uniref:Deoxyribokinase n=1 Tax=candidate division WOR-3 bacterium TaxID=2052148 RepID=A0A7V3PUH3_UNCW3
MSLGKRVKVCVVGSFMTDLVFKVQRFPKPGESMPGEEFGLFLGGKGFNQAICLHRLGAEVVMVGRLGKDYFGDLFLRKMAEEGMTTEFVRQDESAGTGVACPIVDRSGENAIIGVARANLRIDLEQVEAAREELESADVLMLQFEVPHQVSFRAAAIAKKVGALVILDPAPVHNVQAEIDESVDYIVPNEIEAQALARGLKVEDWAAREVRAGRSGVVISIGDKGALVFDQAGQRHFPPFKIKPVDTTGAGDAFRAGLAISLAEGKGIDAAVRFANAVGALACLVNGAEPSMPHREQVEKFIKEQE